MFKLSIFPEKLVAVKKYFYMTQLVVAVASAAEFFKLKFEDVGIRKQEYKFIICICLFASCF